MSAPYRYQSLRIGQPQIEQDNVKHTPRKMLLGLAHASHVRQFSVVRAFIEPLAEQTGVSGVVFDQEDRFDRFLVHPLCVCCGNLTFVSQKSLMLFTKPSKASNCTGLQR